jgi:hypothetical protein
MIVIAARDFWMRDLTMISRFGLLWIATGILAGCAASSTVAPDAPQPGMGSESSAQDSVVYLRAVPAADSVVLHRGDASIVLAMADVEVYFAQWPLPPDMAQLRNRLRSEFQEDGWAELGTGMLPDVVAAHLITQGKATVRSPQGVIFPWVRTATEQEVTGTTVVTHRLLYTPTGAVLLRVLHSIAIS